jgi:hypothetical protein
MQATQSPQALPELLAYLRENGFTVRQNDDFDGTTEAFAALNQVKAQTVRKRLCETGSYFGVIPEKLANRKLVWPRVRAKA